MPRTILAIAQEAADRDATAPAPASLFDNPSRIAKLMRIAAQDVIRDYLRTCSFGVSEFQATWVFALQPGRYAYPLPPDYLRIIGGTEQRAGWPMSLIGPATPQAWASWVFGGAAAPTQTGWRIRNNAILVEPTPSVEELVAIEYVSRWPVVGRMTDADVDLSGSIPVFRAPHVPRDGAMFLKNDVLLRKRRPEDFDYDDPPGFDVGLWASEPMEALRRIKPTSAQAPFPQVRKETFTADDDMPAFDDDHLLSLGMTFRLRRALGQPYEEHAAEYEREMTAKAVADAGGARPFLIGDETAIADVVPLGSGKWLVS